MRIIVVGGVAAGMSAASQARRRDPDCEVIVLQREHDISYSACGMPYNIGDPSRMLEDLIILDVAQARNRRGIDVRVGCEVSTVDTVGRRVTVRHLATNETYILQWDRLILATGAKAVMPKLPGLDLPGVFALRDMTDARGIKELLGRANVRQAVVIGAGYIGLEMADILHGRGIEVTVVEKATTILPGFDMEIIDVARRELDKQGVLVKTETSLKSVQQHGQDLVVNTDHGELIAQLVIVAGGVSPNVALAQAAGITIGETGAIATDDAMQTNIAGIYAAGDCTQAWHLVAGKPSWIALGTTANKQGKVAGANAAGAHERFGGIVGTAGFKLFDLEVARTGLGQPEIDRLQLDAVRSVSRHHSRALHYPGDQPITTVLFAQRTTGRLLGAQMIGGDTVAKRIDVFATALHAQMNIGQIEELDLSYAPPFAPVYDPILIAAAVASKDLGRLADH